MLYTISLKRGQIFEKWSGKDITVLCLETKREFSATTVKKKKKKKGEEKQKEILTVEFQAINLRKKKELSEGGNVPPQRNILLISLQKVQKMKKGSCITRVKYRRVTRHFSRG